MSDRIARVLVLAEDLLSANFFRRYLQRSVDPRAIILEICRDGSGEQFIRKRYPVEVAEQRNRVYGKNRNVALLVHLDADLGTVQNEHDQLAASLRAAGHSARGDLELIAIVVPKRHSETWLHGLCGMPVTEDQDCKRDLKDHERKLRPAAEALFKLTRKNAAPPPPSLPALQAAIDELRRLE